MIVNRIKLEKKVMVSVCSSTYNHVNFIKDALNGFLMQKTDFIFEIIIYDDCSTDGTTDIIKEYVKKYPEIIKPVYQDANQFGKLFDAGMDYGYAPLTKFVFPKAKGKYIALCEGDDYWTDPLKLQKQVDFLEKNPEYVYSYHACNLLTEAGTIHIYCKDGDDFTQAELVALPAGLATSTKMFRNLYNENKEDFAKFSGDAFLTCYLGLHGKCKYIADIKPSIYRQHSGGVWHKKNYEEKKRLYKKSREKLYDLFVEKGIPEFIAIRRRSSGRFNYFGIVIPTYRREDGKTPFYLKRALDSVFNQTYKDFKVFLIGDCYDDLEELKAIISEYPKDQIYFKNLDHAIEREKYKNNKMVLWTCGGTNASNFGISKLQEEGLKLVCLLDHDDYWEPNHLEVINNVIEKEHPAWVCTKSNIGNLRPGTKYLPEVETDKEYIDFLPLAKHVIKSSTCWNLEDIATRIRNVFEETGQPFPGDADLWERMAWHIPHFGLKSFMINKITCIHDAERYTLEN
jgi:glycosyltransferase involved in cell wall biosynthesis